MREMANACVRSGLVLAAALLLTPAPEPLRAEITLVRETAVRQTPPAPPRAVAPQEAGFDPRRLARVDSILRAAVRDGVTPGAALAVGRYGSLVRLRGYGRTDWAPRSPVVTDSTLYDIASLTKAVGTATVAAQLIAEGRLLLHAPIHLYLRTWPAHGAHGDITVRHLLGHTSGLPAGADLWPDRRTRVERIAGLARLPVRTRPGTERVYSDIGMILLAAVLEEVTGSRLDDLLHARVFRPLGMRDTRFNPLQATPDGGSFTLARIAPTERDAFLRMAHVHGVVHDLNAWALDGVAGHAGIFSSARDLAAYAQAALDGLHGRATPLFPAGTFRSWIRHESAFGRPLGWDAPVERNSSAGEYFTRASIGHTGFTGTSLWIDPERDLFVVLLTNRVNPSATNRAHVQLRRDVHDAVQLAIDDMPIRPREGAVRP